MLLHEVFRYSTTLLCNLEGGSGLDDLYISNTVLYHFRNLVR